MLDSNAGLEMPASGPVSAAAEFPLFATRGASFSVASANDGQTLVASLQPTGIASVNRVVVLPVDFAIDDAGAGDAGDDGSNDGSTSDAADAAADGASMGGEGGADAGPRGVTVDAGKDTGPETYAETPDGPVDADHEPAEGSSGCGCRVVPTGTPQDATLTGLGLLVAMAAARRRARTRYAQPRN